MPAPIARPSCHHAGRPRIRYGSSFSGLHTPVGSDSSRSAVTGSSHKQPYRPARRNRKGDSVAPGSGMYNAPQTKKVNRLESIVPPRQKDGCIVMRRSSRPHSSCPIPAIRSHRLRSKTGADPQRSAGNPGKSHSKRNSEGHRAPNARCKDTKKEDARGGTDTLFSFYRNIFRPKRNSRLQHAVSSRFVDPTIRNPVRAWRWPLS